MAESVKISELLKDSKSSSDISIKEILEIIKAVKELAQMQHTQQQPQQVVSYKDNVKQQPQPTPQPQQPQQQQKQTNAEDVYNQFINALEQLSMLYGEDISVKEFKQKLKDDKETLIKMIKGAIKG